MPRPKAATVPRLDPLAEIRQLRARQAALREDLHAKRDELLAEVSEIDEALAELGGVGELAVAALVPKPAQVPSAPRQPKATPAARAPEAKGIRAGDPVAAELVELLPWIGAAGGKDNLRRDAIRLRASGVAVTEIAGKFGSDRKAVENAITHGRTRMREARAKGKPGETPASDDEPAPAQSSVRRGAPFRGGKVKQLPNGKFRYSFTFQGAEHCGPSVATCEEAERLRVIAAAAVADLHPDALPIAIGLVDRDIKPANDIPPPVSVEKRSEPPQNIPDFIPTGWDRSDPDEDFADIAPAAEDSPAQMAAPVAGGPSRVDGLADLRPWFGAINPETIQAVEMGIGGMSVPEIAARLNRSERSIKVSIAVAAKWLCEYRDRYPAGLPSGLAWNRTRLRIVDPSERARPIAPRKMRAQVAAGAELDYPADVDRPVTRGDCQNTPRPCPFVTCSHHLYLDVNPETGALKLNFPHLEVDQMAETCSLDVADRGGITLEEVGAILNLTRERVRQIEVGGISKMQDGHFEKAPDRLGSPLAEAIEG